MNRNTILPILGANGHGQDAADAFHIAMQRNRERRALIADKPVSLGTHYSADESPPQDAPDVKFEMDKAIAKLDGAMGPVGWTLVGLSLLLAVAAIVLVVRGSYN